MHHFIKMLNEALHRGLHNLFQGPYTQAESQLIRLEGYNDWKIQLIKKKVVFTHTEYKTVQSIQMYLL